VNGLAVAGGTIAASPKGSKGTADAATKTGVAKRQSRERAQLQADDP
jgi:hypothetical protein